VKFLLENGATPDVSGLEMNIGPLEWACQNQFVDIAELLVEHGANVNSRNEFGDVCLESLYSGEFCFQVTNEMLDITEILLDKGIDVNGWNGREGMPPLHHALNLLGCEELVLLLVSHGANVRQDNQYGSNAFEVCLKKQGKRGISLNTKMEQAYQVFCSTVKDDADISVEGVEQE
jgi:ankyrin repeat protein